MKSYETLQSFLIYCIVILGLLFLRLSGNYPYQFILFSESMLEISRSLLESFHMDSFLSVIAAIPPKILIILSGCVQITMGLIALLFFKKDMEQGVMILIKQPFDAIKSGLCLYFLFIAVLFVFIYSIIGLPVSVGFIGIGHIIIALGNIPVSIFMGYMLAERLNMSGYTVIYFFIGSFVRLLCESIYTLSGAFLFFIFPVLSMGVFFLMIANKKIYMKQYKIEFKTKANEETFDKKKIRDIITKGLK